MRGRSPLGEPRVGDGDDRDDEVLAGDSVAGEEDKDTWELDPRVATDIESKAGYPWGAPCMFLACER